MSQQLVLEALYPEMEEATIGQWLVAVGDQVVPGQSLAELITDKVVYEYQSPSAGTILLLLAAGEKRGAGGHGAGRAWGAG